jgi:hypothetical protein
MSGGELKSTRRSFELFDAMVLTGPANRRRMTAVADRKAPVQV